MLERRNPLRPLSEAAIIILAFNGPMLTAGLSAQESVPAADPAEVPEGKANLHRMLDESASRYALYASKERGEQLKLHCVLRWANVTRGSVDGATYIWTADGRPMATVCVYPFAGRLCDNFQSLAEGPVTAWVDGKPVWRCEQPGLEYQPIADAPAPEESAAGRLRQMKSLAQRFNTTLVGWKADDSDREVLRMLPRPVYRYENDQAKDGTVFAFVQGTDPEAFLLIEARPDASNGGNVSWQFAMARRTSGALETHYDSRLVWKAKRLTDYSDPKQPHFQMDRPLSLVEPIK
ncbi:MAG TPA: hypothetical protein VG826_00545 [Pirellulales bacterium]|nr:hypothetical protein [Pirellulales bacterium]